MSSLGLVSGRFVVVSFLSCNLVYFIFYFDYDYRMMSSAVRVYRTLGVHKGFNISKYISFIYIFYRLIGEVVYIRHEMSLSRVYRN